MKCITNMAHLKEALRLLYQQGNSFVYLRDVLKLIDTFTTESVDEYSILSSVIDKFKNEEILRNMEMQLKIQQNVISECIKAQQDDPTSQSIKYDSVLSFARYMLALNSALLTSLDYYRNNVDYEKEYDMLVKQHMLQKKGE